MPGTAQTFLKYNITNAMKHLLALEAHARALPPSYASEEASCLVKHALSLEEQSDEGLSHSSELNDKAKYNIFQEVRQGAIRLRELFAKRTNPVRILQEIRMLRKKAEALDPSFNLEKCKSCGGDFDAFMVTEAPHGEPSLSDLEEKNANHVLHQFAEREGVSSPKLVIDPGCSDPNKGVYDRGTIRVCKGAVSNHILLHEAGHHLQYLRGEPLNEDDAEQYALTAAGHGPHDGKALNVVEAKEYGRGKFRMRQSLKPKWPIKSLIAIEVVGVAASAIEPLNDWADTTYPSGLLGQKSSTFVDIAGAALFGVGALYMKPGKATIPMAVASSYFVNDWFRKNIIPRILPAAGVRYASQARLASPNMATSMSRTVRMTPNGTPVPSPSVVHSKYDIVAA